jgi:cold shock protein
LPAEFIFQKILGDQEKNMGAAEMLLQYTKHTKPRETGIVKWFNSERGFGFIQRREGEADIFVHHSAIQMKGYRSLVENQPVEFELGSSPKGPIAVNVVPLQ